MSLPNQNLRRPETHFFCFDIIGFFFKYNGSLQFGCFYSQEKFYFLPETLEVDPSAKEKIRADSNIPAADECFLFRR